MELGSGFFELIKPAKDTNVLTNGDDIRARDDEGLVEFVETIFGECPWCHDNCDESHPCSYCISKWLKQPAEVNYGG